MGITEATAMRLTSAIFLLLTLVAFGMTFYDDSQRGFYFVFGGSQTTYQTTTHWVLALCLHFPVILLFLIQLWATCSQTINAMGIGNSQVFGFPGRRMLLGIAIVGVIGLFAVPAFSDAVPTANFFQRTFLCWVWDLHLAHFALCVVLGLNIIAVEPSFHVPQYGNGAFGNPYNQNAVGQGFGGFHDRQLHPQDAYVPRSPVGFQHQAHAFGGDFGGVQPI